LFDRLSKIDLSWRLDPVAPRLPTQVALASALLILVGVARAIVDLLTPGVVPFALLFPAVLVATIIAGWRSGAMVMVVGGAYAWFSVMHHRSWPMTANSGDLVSLLLYLLAAGSIVLFAETHRRNVAALTESQARLDLATAASGVGVWEWRLADNAMLYSEQAKAICGFPAGQPVTYEMVAAVTHPQDYPRTLAQAQRALDPAIRDEQPYEYRIVPAQGDERWVIANGRAVFETVDGLVRASRYVGTLQDISARKAAEAERAEWATQLRLAVDAGRMAVWHVDARRGIIPSPDLNRLLGFPEDAEPSLYDLYRLYMPGEMERIREAAQATLARGEHYFEAEYRAHRPDGAVRWMLARAEIVATPTGRPGSAIGVVMDITDRKDSEERLKLLAREVDHRANNLLAVVQSTIQLSQAETMQALKEVLLGRVAALGRAHQLLSEARWEGADLRRLVEEELLAFSLGAAARVTIRGDETALPPAAAQAIAMGLHELATNAAKYGSLSAPEGRVEVSWSREGRGPLIIRWVESGGPAVKPPTRRGLGATMLARALAGPLKGETRLDWRPEGLVCELELPGAAVETAAVAGS
jgi:PAS domain S-box-containing protein